MTKTHLWICLLAAAALPAQETRPNFVFLLGEGQGWSSLSVAMDPGVPASKSESFRTPNFERLAASGMRFASFYAPSPRCTPSRATFFTGKSPAQLGMTFVTVRGGANVRLSEPAALLEIPVEETTIAELLEAEGYATAHFGKWHVGRPRPARAWLRRERRRDKQRRPRQRRAPESGSGLQDRRARHGLH